MALMFQPIRTPSRSDQVYEQLENAIYAGKVGPGHALREIPLAKQFGVSQATIRHALFELEHSGLVDKEPGSGTRVKNLTLGELDERIEVRIPLEQIAAQKACGLLSEEDYAALTAIIQQIPDESHPQADASFHRYIWRRAQNSLLYRTLDQLASPLFAFVSIMRDRGLQDIQQRVTSHEVLLERLRKAREGAPSDLSALNEQVKTHAISAYAALLESRQYQDFKSLAEHTQRGRDERPTIAHHTERTAVR